MTSSFSEQYPKNSKDSARTILQRYGDAWRGRQEMEMKNEFVLAFWVKGQLGGEFQLRLSVEAGAHVQDGISEQFDLGFELDIEFLRRLDRGEISALTAMGQARSDDPIPLLPRFGENFMNIPNASLLFRQLAFHFWNREWPETMPFGEQASRFVHGGNAAVLVYDKNFRSAWYQLKPGMHINSDPDDRINDFPQLIVITRGQFKGRLDGRDRTLAEGEALLIPAKLSHEFWAGEGEGGEMVWIAFGEGV